MPEWSSQTPFTATDDTLISAWRQQFFSTTQNTGPAANTADPDQDGLNNLGEYAFNLHPLRADADQSLQANRNANGQMQLTLVRIADPSLTYEIQTSSDFIQWTTALTSSGTQNISGSFTYTDTTAPSQPTRRFYRFRVQR
jgi:hypothetical protein